jgi:CheY-like chemotaxis protein
MAITAISKKSKAAKQVAKALILIVEDDALQAEILKDHLKSSTNNCTIISYSSGEDCMKGIGSKKPTIAFIDFNLNSKNKKAMNGLKLSKKIKELIPNCETILLSDKNMQKTINEALKNSSIKYARVLVFSDDFALAKKLFGNIEVPFPVQFAESPDDNPEESLMLMSKSDALVISNSSFSWWAAQFGNKSKFVVRPSKWFRAMLDPEELFPPEWHSQESQWEI